MAINTENRMVSSGLTKLEKKNYATQVDSTEVKSLSELANGTSFDKLGDLGNFNTNDLLCYPSIKDHDASLESLGQFENPFCCKYPPLNLRIPKYKLDLDRDLDLTFNIDICGESKKINPIDYVMKATSFINKNPGIFSPDANTRLRALLSSDMVQKMNIAGLGNVIPNCILEKTGGFLSSAGSPYGSAGSLSLRQQMDQALSKDKCARLVASQVGLYDFLAASNQSHFINMIMDGDPTRAETYFSAVLGVQLERISFMTGYSRSFTEAYAYDQTYSKLSALTTLETNNLITEKDKIYFNVDSSDILTSLANDKTENKDLDKIEKALDFMSPDWNKDELGNKNLYKTKDNLVIADLVNNKLLNSYEEDIDLDGDYTTVLTTDHHIAIVNAFKD